MATVNGTAANAEDLFDTLLDFVRDNGWTLVESGSDTLADGKVRGVQLKGTDTAGDGAIYVHLIYRAATSSDVYAIEIEGSAGWISGNVLSFGYNPQNSYRDVGTSSSVIVRTPLHRNPIQFWLTASPRRFMGAFRHNDRWGSMYCGYVLPYGMPSQWAYPLWVAGNNITTNDYKTIVNGCCWGASAVISGMLYMPSGRWLPTPLSTGVTGGRTYGVQVWPYKMAPASNLLELTYPLKDSSGVERYVLYKQMLYCSNVAEYGTFGEADGMEAVSAWGASGGDTLTFSGKTYLLVQREMSTANSTAVAMLLE
jgi:hypothetical protein